jgi:hypothetical protein
MNTRRGDMASARVLCSGMPSTMAQPSTAHTHNLFGMLMDQGWKVEEEKVKKYHKKKMWGERRERSGGGK